MITHIYTLLPFLSQWNGVEIGNEGGVREIRWGYVAVIRY